VPLAPHVDGWHGLVVKGVLARSVRDTALFYDAIAEGPSDPGAAPVPPCSFLGALGQTDAKTAGESSSGAGHGRRTLRIALATKLPPSPLTKLHPENRAALDETVALLRRLGHEVQEREIDYGPLVPPPEFTAIYLRSVHESTAELAHPERLERRIRALARLGGMLPPSVVDWALARQADYSARLNEPLADHDVLLMPVTPAPPPKIGAREGRGWLATTVAASATVPYAAPWNFTGQPACSVPAGFAADGLPRAVQFVGKPSDEATLVALAGQLEAERPWTQQRPSAFT
jgi:amidase